MNRIYVLALKGGKYYVGKSKNLTKRISRHLDGKGSAWTKKYPPLHQNPIRVIEGDDYDEDKITLQWMGQHGIDNVRGGTFCQLTLDDCTTSVIRRMINGASDRCFICGSAGHFSNRCPSVFLDSSTQSSQSSQSLQCSKCHRYGHIGSDCDF